MVQDRAIFLQWRTNRKSHMVYRTAPFSMTLTPNPRVRVLTLGLGLGLWLELGIGYEHLGNRTKTFKWYHFQ